MFDLILTACLAGSPGDCGRILLPEAETATKAECDMQAERISQGWLADRPELTGRGATCQPGDELPALPLQEIASGLYVFLGEPVQLEQSANGHIANLGVVIGADSVAVIDSGVSRKQGQELYAAIRQLTDLPISHVILTHMHPDHALGTSVFKEAGAEIVGHAALPVALEYRAQTYLDNIAALYPPQQSIGTEIVLPDRTVADDDVIQLGDRELLLKAEGTAHTDNDLTVFDSKTETFFSGDLIFRELTPVVDGSLNGWLEWLEVAPSPMPRLIVPGHGRVAKRWESAVAPQTEFLTILRDATRAAIADGLPMSGAVSVISQSLRSVEDGWNSFEQTAARDATAAYKELEWE